MSNTLHSREYPYYLLYGNASWALTTVLGYTEENYRKYLNLMHDYNDMKDLASAYMGHLATLKQCTVRELYKQYGLDPEND